MENQAVASSSRQVLRGDEGYRDGEGDEKWIQLPSRRKYFITVTSVAFLAGVGFGVGYAVRYSRRMRLEELRAAADATLHQNHGHATTSTVAGSMQQPMNVATTQGPFALFKEMNRAAYVRFTGKEADTSEQTVQSTPTKLLKRPIPIRHKVSESSTSGSAPPSILMRSPTMQPRNVIEETSKVKAESLDAVEELPLGQTPAVLGAKALGIATAIVGITALVGVEVVFRVLGVKNTDELVDRLSMIIPASEQTSKAFEPVGRAARKVLGGTFGDNEDREATSIIDQRDETINDDLRKGQPLGDVEDTLQQLDEAVDRGDTQTWFEILSKRLNAERTFDIAERRRRIAAVEAEST